jgi:hypothetical protein
VFYILEKIRFTRTTKPNKGVFVTDKKKRTRKKPDLTGLIQSGVIFIGDCQFFAGSPIVEFDPSTGQAKDVTPVDPLNPFNTIDRTFDIVGDGDKNLEIKPYIPGRGVLLNTHLQNGRFLVKKKIKNGKLIGYSILIEE